MPHKCRDCKVARERQPKKLQGKSKRLQDTEGALSTFDHIPMMKKAQSREVYGKKDLLVIKSDKSGFIAAYAATDQAEFFAVSSEYFFSRPQLMRRRHPEIYKMLNLCFNPQKKKKLKS